MLTIQNNSEINKIGIEINDLDLSKTLSVSLASKLVKQLHIHQLLIIRNQKLTEEQLIGISLNFGEPIPAIVPTFRLENFPLITRHSNMKGGDNNPIGAMAPEYVFHSDSYFTVNPNKSTLLYSIKSPAQGGETFFVDMCSAYETLDKFTQQMIEGKHAIYKNAYLNQPPVIHPLVRVDPVTKRKALFVNKHRALGIKDMDDQISLSLLSRLYHHATRSECIYKHKWSDGDLLIWYNPTTMHCATFIDNDQERLLHRILIKGDLPVI